MSSTVENFKFPVGSRENPAMTCKELVDVDNIQDGKGGSYSGPRGFFLSLQGELTPEAAITCCCCGLLLPPRGAIMKRIDLWDVQL